VQPHLRPPGFSRDSHYIVFLDREGSQTASLVTVQGTEWFVEKGGAIAAPYSHRFLADATANAFYLGSGRGAELTEFNAYGSVNRRLRLPIDRKIISRADYASARERFVARASQNLRRTIGENLDRAIAGVDSFPAFTDLKAGEDGSLWLELYDPPGESSRWIVIDPVRGMAKNIILPADVTMLDATADLVVVLSSDELDREVVRVFRILR